MERRSGFTNNTKHVAMMCLTFLHNLRFPEMLPDSRVEGYVPQKAPIEIVVTKIIILELFSLLYQRDIQSKILEANSHELKQIDVTKF